VPTVLEHPPAAPAKPRLRGVSHLWAFVISLPVGLLLVATAPDGAARVGACIYVLGVWAMLGVSAAYHRVGWSAAAHRRLSRLDHSTIFIGIAATYTPVALVCLNGWARTLILTVVWTGAAVGVILQWLPVTPPRWAFTAAYIVVGWCALLVAPQLWEGVGPAGFLLFLAGGVAYSVGAVVYARQRPDPWPETFGYHELFHACTVVALVLHFVAIAVFVLPKG
jgi:hemolysin III